MPLLESEIMLLVLGAGAAGYTYIKGSQPPPGDYEPGDEPAVGDEASAAGSSPRYTKSAQVNVAARTQLAPAPAPTLYVGTGAAGARDTVQGIKNPWTVTSGTFLADLAAVLAPIAYKIGEANAAALTPTEQGILNGASRIQWQTDEIATQNVRFIAKALTDLGGLSNQGSPVWEPPGFNQGALNVILGGPKSLLYVRKKSYNDIYGALPYNPKSYLCEMTLAYAIDIGMKILATQYNASFDPMKTIETALNKLCDQGQGLLNDAITGKEVNSKSALSAGTKTIVDSFKEFMKQLFAALKGEIERSNRHNQVVQKAVAGVRKLAGIIGCPEPFPCTSMGFSLDMSGHYDAYPTPVAGWFQVCDREGMGITHFLGGIYPGPLIGAYANMTSGNVFMPTSFLEIGINIDTLRAWIKHNRTDGYGSEVG